MKNNTKVDFNPKPKQHANVTRLVVSTRTEAKSRDNDDAHATTRDSCDT